MPKQIFGAESVVTTLNRAFNDISPSNATFNNQVAAAGTTTDSFMAFAKQYGAGYTGLTADALSTLILGNLGLLPNTALQTGLKDYITAAGISNVGIIALQLGDILSGLENATGDQAAFKPAAAAWNAEVTASYNYSSNPANTGPSDSGNAQPGTTFTLVVGADNLAPNSAVVANKTSAGDDTIRAVTALSLETVDVIDGGSGNDTLAISAGALVVAGSAPILKSIETINITSAVATDILNLTSSTGINAINVTSTNAASVVTLNNVATLDTVIGTGLSTAASTIDVDFTASTAGAADTLKVALGNNNGSVATIQSTADTATFEAITIAANGSKSGTSVAGNNAADVVIFNNADFNTVKTLTVTGDGNSNITTASAALKTVTASAANGNNTYLLAGAAGKTVTTGSGNDTVTTGAGDDTITTGAGNDTISAAGGTNKYVGGLGGDTYTGGGTDSFSIETSTIEDLGYDTVSAAGFTSGADTLIFVGGPAGAAANYVEVTASSAGFVAARSAALTSLAGNSDLKYVAVYDGADTFVFFDGNGDHALSTNGSDFAVKLTGVNLAGIAAGDIVVA